MRRGSRWVAALVVSTIVARLGAAPTEAEAQRAESLFQEARKEMDAGDFASACPKLVEAQRIDPGGGTLLALALCREGEGHDATALSLFYDALAAAKKSKREDRVTIAATEIAKIEAVVSRVVVVVDEVPGLVVTLDDVAVDKLQRDRGVPVEPGTHRIAAKASGYKDWSRSIVVAPRDRQEVAVRLELAPTPIPAPLATPSTGSFPVAGALLLGVGAVGLGVGAGFGLRALSRTRSYKSECPIDVCIDPHGVTLHDQAKSAATISTVAFAAGLAVGAAGLVLVLSHGESNARVTPAAGPGVLGFSFSSAF